MKLRITLLLLALLPAAANAATFAITSYDAHGYSHGSTSAYVSQGFRFSPNEDITVLELGFFDSSRENGPGLVRSYPMAIVDSSDNILGSVVVPAGTAGRLDGPYDPAEWHAGDGFRYTALDTPVALTAGVNYAVVSLTTPGAVDVLPGCSCPPLAVWSWRSGAGVNSQ